MKLVFTPILLLLFFLANTQTVEKFNINFDFDKYEITPQATQRLDSFIQSTNISSIQKIFLYGHCDAIGSNIYNDALSIKRVNAAKEFLVKYLPEIVIDTLEGFGKRQPLNNNSSEAERFINRRVEIIVHRKEVIDTAQIPKAVEPNKEPSLAEKIKDTTTKAGTNIILKNLNFYGGRHFLLPQSLPTVTELLSVMAENPTLEIEIHGHICCMAGPEDGLDIDTKTEDLSVNRARAIYEYLIKNGIEPQRLKYKGFGHSRPLIYPEDTEERRTTNRRVEIKIVKK